MNQFARTLACLLLALAAAQARAGDFAEPRAGLHTGGQPTLDDLKRLQAEGVGTIIDLRGPQEARGFDEAGEAEKLGLAYIALPIAGKDDITPENAARLRALLARQEGEVLLHCASGNRVGALLALDAVAQGVPPGEALELGRKAGLRSLEPVVVERLSGPASAEPL